MRGPIVISFVFRLSCLVIFLYQAWISFEDYEEKRTFSNSRFTRQENTQLPQVCITAKAFEYDSFKNLLNITHDEYEDGKWKADGFSEKETWEFLSPNLTNLVEKFYVYKTLQNDSDKYSKVKVSVDKNLDGYEKYGISIKQKNYRSNLKIYCLVFRLNTFFLCIYKYNSRTCRKEFFKFGIQKLKIYPNSRIILYNIPPGGYFSISRKPNKMIIERDWSYGYIVNYRIYEKFNKNNSTCDPHLNFNEDECKQNQAN